MISVKLKLLGRRYVKFNFANLLFRGFLIIINISANPGLFKK